jgi:hypothetical protein
MSDERTDALAIVEDTLNGMSEVDYALSVDELEALASELRWLRMAVGLLARHAQGGEGTNDAATLAGVRDAAKVRGIALAPDFEQARAELRALLAEANTRALATLEAARPN